MAGTWPRGWVTGFCAIKHCEGTKPKGILTGTPMQTCMGASGSCTCACHKKLDEMYKMVGLERVTTQNPDYKPASVTWWMPTAEDRAMWSETKKDTPPPVVVPSIMPDVLPPTVVVQRTESTSGRRVKGALEDEVRAVTDLWVALAMPQVVCSPAWIAEKIDAENPPSTGAISAVLDRWVEYGFATMEKKPTRFTGYTEAGIKKGLHTMKAEYKHTKKRQSQAGSRR